MSDQLVTAQNFLAHPEVLTTASPPVRLAVLGDPVAHSRSPAMHNAALAALGLEFRYVAIHASAEEFPTVVQTMARAGWIGANVTIPHKYAAATVCSTVEPYAKMVGAVNTLVFESGEISGFNTDGPGLVRAIREEFYVDLRDLRVLLLGAGGGAGRAIACQCALEACERLVLVNRTFEKARALAQELAPRFRSDRLLGPSDRCLAIPWETNALREQIAQSDLIINATSIGMKRTDPPALTGNLLTPNLLIYDTVYSTARTRLLEEAQSVGARGANGLSMLLHQGALSFEIWFNRSAPLEAMRKVLLAPSPAA